MRQNATPSERVWRSAAVGLGDRLGVAGGAYATLAQVELAISSALTSGRDADREPPAGAGGSRCSFGDDGARSTSAECLGYRASRTGVHTER